MVSEAKPRDLFPKGDFKVVRKGYEPGEVDKYVARLRRSATDQLTRVEALEKALADAARRHIIGRQVSGQKGSGQSRCRTGCL